MKNSPPPQNIGGYTRIVYSVGDAVLCRSGELYRPDGVVGDMSSQVPWRVRHVCLCMFITLCRYAGPVSGAADYGSVNLHIQNQPGLLHDVFWSFMIFKSDDCMRTLFHCIKR